MIITIDGPSGTGKTTIARLVAEKLGFSYFDTGAMYRAFSWYLLDKNISPADSLAIENALQGFSFSIKEGLGGKCYFVNDRDVTEAIRSKAVTDIVSVVSSYRAVRDLLSRTQREHGKKGSAVFEGRDLGTVIFPHADLKIYLTARAEVRAERRHLELKSKNLEHALSQQDILLSINKRDELDSNREIAPLSCPQDAFVVDTSDQTIDQVVELILSYLKNGAAKDEAP